MERAEQILKDVQAEGFTVDHRLNEGDERGRFFVYKLTLGDRTFVLKIASPDQERELQNEVWWNLTLTRLVEAYPDCKLVPPQILMSAPSHYIGQYFDAPALQTDSRDMAQTERWVEPLAQVLVDLDQLALSPKLHGKPDYEASQSAAYTNLWGKVEKWLEKPLAQGMITEQEKARAKEQIESRLSDIQPALQHGDFVPWHMFDLGDGKIGLIDGEHASLTKPRYYDLAYLYTRLATRQQSFEQASKVLREFLKLSMVDEAEFLKSWLPVITLRSLGMYNDAIADLKIQDYRPQAKELLQRSFSGQLKDFTKE